MYIQSASKVNGLLATQIRDRIT